jgi:hypothetical protein
MDNLEYIYVVCAWEDKYFSVLPNRPNSGSSILVDQANWKATIIGNAS